MTDVVQLAAELIQVPSPSLSPNEPIATLVRRRLTELGFDPVEEICYRDPWGTEKRCLVARLGPEPVRLVFCSHLDTVPARRYEPVVRDGRLYGRGACDMKGPLAAVLAAVAAVGADGLACGLGLVCTADEEIGYLGAEAVARESRLFRSMAGQAEAGVITEPTQLEVVHGHKASVLIRAVAKGEAAHSSTDRGRNANLDMIPFLAEMKLIHDELRTSPRWRDPRFDPPWPGWNIVVSDHETPANVTAPECVCSIAWRPMPGQPFEPILDRVRRAAERNNLELTIVGADQQPLYLPPDHPTVQQILQVTGGGSPRLVPYGTDGAIFGKFMPAVVLGPGSIEQAHRDDEYIEVDQLKRGVDVYAGLIRHFCGTKS